MMDSITMTEVQYGKWEKDQEEAEGRAGLVMGDVILLGDVAAKKAGEEGERKRVRMDMGPVMGLGARKDVGVVFVGEEGDKDGDAQDAQGVIDIPNTDPE